MRRVLIIAGAVVMLVVAVFLVIKVVSHAGPACQTGKHLVTTSEYTYGYRFLPTGKWGYGWGNDVKSTCVKDT